MKPVIGITASILLREQGISAGTERTFVNNDYIEAVIRAGGIPVILPIMSEDDLIAMSINSVDGIIFSGGVDINPLFYQEEPVPKLGEVFVERDEYEFKAVKAAYQSGKPILGICRGIQLLNVVFGGSLYQDLETQYPSTVAKHVQEARRDVKTHSVVIEKDTLLNKIMGTTAIQTNSFHHQAVKSVAPGFRVCARAADGVIEGIEKQDYPFLLGVQWHPEGMFSKHDEMLRLFTALVKAANTKKELA